MFCEEILCNYDEKLYLQLQINVNVNKMNTEMLLILITIISKSLKCKGNITKVQVLDNYYASGFNYNKCLSLP